MNIGKMLSEVEEDGCTDILQRLSVNDLYSLSDTITKKVIKPSSKNEAIKVILEFSNSATELLQRKKVKRDILFQYLNDKNVKISLSADKRGLIVEVLKGWGSLIDYDMLDLPPDKNYTPRPTAARKTSTESADSAYASSASPGSGQINIQVHNHFHSPVVSAQTTFNFSPEKPPETQTTNNSNNPTSANSELQSLGEKFTQWFYEIINSYNPAMAGEQKEFGPQHFWDDVILTINTPNKMEEKFHGPEPVSHCFLKYTKDESLLFNANISPEGVNVRSSPHGLVAIMVCGTVHRGNECLGTFQQMFGIIKDPRFNNNWKIKMSKLQVVANAVHGMPQLPSSAESELLAVTSGTAL